MLSQFSSGSHNTDQFDNLVEFGVENLRSHARVASRYKRIHTAPYLLLKNIYEDDGHSLVFNEHASSLKTLCWYGDVVYM